MVRNGVIEGSVDMTHFDGCRPLSRVEAAIQNIDRKCRKDLQRGAVTPRQSWTQVATSLFNSKFIIMNSQAFSPSHLCSCLLLSFNFCFLTFLASIN